MLSPDFLHKLPIISLKTRGSPEDITGCPFLGVVMVRRIQDEVFGHVLAVLQYIVAASSRCFVSSRFNDLPNSQVSFDLESHKRARASNSRLSDNCSTTAKPREAQDGWDEDPVAGHDVLLFDRSP